MLRGLNVVPVGNARILPYREDSSSSDLVPHPTLDHPAVAGFHKSA